MCFEIANGIQLQLSNKKILPTRTVAIKINATKVVLIILQFLVFSTTALML